MTTSSPRDAVTGADVVVVGFGAAGAAVALAAADRGASVVIVEKQPEGSHTPSTRMSGGVIMAATDAGDAARYLDACAGGLVPPAVNAAFAEALVELPAWLDKIGADLRLLPFGGPEHPGFDGASSIVALRQGRLRDGTPSDPAPTTETTAVASGWQARRSDPNLRTGFELMDALAAAVARRPSIRVLWGTPVRRLLRDGTGRVTGVQTDAGTVGAGLGVALTTGGFEFAGDLKAAHLPAGPVYFYGNPGNTGDGIRLAQDVGADLWHMTQVVGRGIAHFTREDGSEINFNIGIDSPGYVITDRYGLRYTSEYPQARQKHNFYHAMIAYDADRAEYPRLPSYWFFDERRMTERTITPLGVGAPIVGAYAWSPDNRAEVERGWIHQGASIAEVAAAAGVSDPEQAQRSVDAYNAGCATGVDAFGRPASSLVPLDRPPYYCIPLYPGGSNTVGGPRRDERARVLDVWGDPIPGLYAAGNNGAALGRLYPADGSNLGEALCFGRIAGESLTAES